MIFNMPEKYGEFIPCEEEEIQRSPMFYRAACEFVEIYGTKAQGEFARQAAKLASDYGNFQYSSIDTRTHMLMPGMVPCIPGWHCDDFHRIDGHPQLDSLPPMIHIICVWGHTSPMMFQNTNLDLPVLHGNECLPGETIYGRYNRHLENTKFARGYSRHGQPIVMKANCFHRGTPAEEPGWRMFARATFSNHRFYKNLTRMQTQVYMQDLGAGW